MTMNLRPGFEVREAEVSAGVGRLCPRPVAGRTRFAGETRGCAGGSTCGRFCLLLLLVVGLEVAGCASHDARKRLAGVAKNWCETIRASQVIPVYPLTEDLSPGDVFLVQTPIASQAKLYQQRGFLSLDDRRTRLKDLDYSRVYFDGYWDWGREFGSTPHPSPSRATPAGLTNGGSVSNAFRDAVAPRATFPTYTFEAQSSSGLSLAVPVGGVPVALSFLQADRVAGSVTISDARTYAADEQQLYAGLRAWAQEDDVQQVLEETVRRAGKNPILLRVVSRVYLAGGVVVSLSRSGSIGGRARGGFNPPPVPSVLDTNGNVSASYTNLLKVLSDSANNPISNVVDQANAGGAVRFVAASSSSVSLSEAFNRLLAVGYLGFDVPVYGGGVLGVPLPTFQLLDRSLTAPPATRLGSLTEDQARFQVNRLALKALATTDPRQALKVIASVTRRLSDRHFSDVALKCAEALNAPADQVSSLAQAVFQAFGPAAIQYVSVGGSTGLNYHRFDAAFARAYDERDRE